MFDEISCALVDDVDRSRRFPVCVRDDHQRGFVAASLVCMYIGTISSSVVASGWPLVLLRRRRPVAAAATVVLHRVAPAGGGFAFVARCQTAAGKRRLILITITVTSGKIC